MADNTRIEVDVVRDDADSAIDEQISEFSASLTSSVIDYPVEHGRRYHAYRPGVYSFPNDEAELERLDLTHILMTKGIGEKLYHAPIETEKVHRILDIGTGTGVWAMEMGDLLPSAEILGNDLSPVQPTWVPPNVKFEVDDVESEWSYNKPFDYIFCRYMAVCILDWPKLTKNIYDNLKPGGWAEFQDFDFGCYSEDGTLTESTNTMIWDNYFLQAAEKMGRDPAPGPKLEGWVKAAGFQNVHHQLFKFPLGPWPKDPKLKEVGLINLSQALDGLEGFSLRLFCTQLGWTEEEVIVLMAKVRKEFKSQVVHPIFNFHVVYGQKPLAESGILGRE